MITKHPSLVYIASPVFDDDGLRDLVAIPAEAFPAPVPEERVMKLSEAMAADVQFDSDGTICGQVGALRWSTATGIIEVVYVSPAWRRRGVATAMLGKARWVARESSQPRVRIDDAVSALGLLWANSLAEPVALVRNFCDPLTPVGETEGVDRRLLVPDDVRLVTEHVRHFMAAREIDEDSLGELVDTICGPAAGVSLSSFEVSSVT